jgi:HD-GYP domain-containing protein (c-di-GMP phosphodiesterase class II)
MRLADLLAGLSRLADLGFGVPAGEALRAAALAAVLSRSLGLADDDLRAGLYAALLQHVGCTGYAHEAARVVGDERTMYAATAQTNLTDPRELVTVFLPALLRGHPPLERARLALATLSRGPRIAKESTTAACEVGRDVARRLNLGEQAQRSIYHSYEWWDGNGVPGGLKGEEIPVGARLATLCGTAALLDATAGVGRAVDVVRDGSGKLFDPALAAHFAADADTLLGEVNAGDPHELLLEAEPRPVASAPESRLVEVATVFADLADLKTPYTHGHSREVARLACDAAQRLGLPTTDLRVAALLHDVGRVAVSSSVWDKPGPLSGHEWEQVRLHAYHTERILAGSDRLAALAPLAGSHHERGDGSGYHRGCGHAAMSPAARVLAAADAYQAMRQRRPHRPALSSEQAAQRLSAETRAGRFDADAVRGVLTAAGHDPDIRRELPAGLTRREVDVLALVADGCTNVEISERLVISRRTAEHHVQHIYAKIGASSRAAAALFAMEHGLLETRR